MSIQYFLHANPRLHRRLSRLVHERTDPSSVSTAFLRGGRGVGAPSFPCRPVRTPRRVGPGSPTWPRAPHADGREALGANPTTQGHSPGPTALPI